MKLQQALFFCLLFLLSLAGPSLRADLIVTNCLTDDVRGAIERGGTVTFACDGVVVLTNPIEIANNVCLDASGRSITFSGSNVTRLFKVQPGVLLTLTNLTLANGRSTNGGAIYNEGTVVARDCGFSNNFAIGATGTNGTNGANGISSIYDPSNPNSITPGQPGQEGASGGSALGGAILNDGSVTLDRCYFAGNTASGGAGGQGGNGGNGGWATVGPMMVPMVGADGGNGGAGGAGGAARGGAIANFGTVTLNRCTFSNSLSFGGGGGGGGGGGTAAYLNWGRALAGGAGGQAKGSAIFNMGNAIVSNSVFMEGSGSGGNGGQGGLTLAGQHKWGAGTNGGAAMGAGIYSAGTGVIANCTFVTNRVRGGNGSPGRHSGDPVGNGGDAMGGALANAGTIQAINLTLSGNVVVGGTGGSPGSSLGGSIANTAGLFQIVNSILAWNSVNNCSGVITDLGRNLSTDGTPAWTSGTSLNNMDPLLLPLANNGGPTLTMALRAGSPALNTANCAAAPVTDQRGFPRPAGPGCDIGAYEGEAAFRVQIIRTPSMMLVRAPAAETGRSYRLDACVDFGSWTNIATKTAVGGQVTFPVTLPPTTRFFRIAAE